MTAVAVTESSLSHVPQWMEFYTQEPFCSALRINVKDEGRGELGEFGETLRWTIFSQKKKMD